VSAVEAAKGARDRGLKAIVLKGGAFETVTRAAQVNAEVPGVKAFGGLVMNKPSGGINPAAVEAAIPYRYNWSITPSCSNRLRRETSTSCSGLS